MIKTVLFDLDGTLLSMDNEVFIKYYFKLLLKKMVPYGYDPKELVENIMKATYTVVVNDGSMTNHDRFFMSFNKLMAGKLHTTSDELEKIFEDFYSNEFDEAKCVIDRNDDIRRVIDMLRDNNIDIIIATAPVFPSAAVNKRLSWIGEDIGNFKYVSTYENSTYCKPNIKYYEEIINKNQLDKDSMLMVGNDLNDDIRPCETLGIDTFFIDRYAVNDDQNYQKNRGSFNDLYKYIQNKIYNM